MSLSNPRCLAWLIGTCLVMASPARAEVWRCPGGVYQDEPCQGGSPMQIRPELNAMPAEDRVWSPQTSTILRNAPSAPYVGGTTLGPTVAPSESRPVIEGWAHPGATRWGRAPRHVPPPWTAHPPHHHGQPGHAPTPPRPQPAPAPARNHGGYYLPR